MNWKKASAEERLQEAERRIENARLEGTLSLDLGDLGLSTLPESLGRLERLEELFLGRRRRNEDGKIDREFARLEAGFASLGPLSALRNLRTLHLGALAGDLAPLAQLLNLQSLSISNCPALAGDLAPLAQLLNLQSLSISNSPALAGDLAPLAKLLNLQSLTISFCSALSGDLAPLAKLLNLESIDINNCPALAGDLAPLAKLLNLKSIDIYDCPALAGDLAPLAQLLNLQSLEISDCPALAGDLPVLTELPQLETLRVFACENLVLQRDFVRRHLKKMPPLTKVYCDSVEGVPREILSGKSWEDCCQQLSSYLKDLDSGQSQEKDVKLILLGNGRVGKTQLCRRLRGEEFDPDSPSTHGVKLFRQPFEVAASGKKSTVFANWWDFGGQDIYHSTHSLFLRSRAVFLLLWTPELENSREFKENGIPLRNQTLAYWLDYVRSLAGAQSPIVIVQSQCESFAAERKAPVEAEGFAFYRSCSFGAANDHGRETLESHLRDAIRFLGEKHGELVIGTGRAELRRRLYEMRDADQLLPESERRHRTLTFQFFTDLCQEVGGISSPEHALDYLHQTGAVFYQKGLFHDQIVLDQSWALDAIYSVFDRLRAFPALREKGRFTRKDLELLCWEGKSPEEQQLLLGLMTACGICFVHRKDELNAGNTSYLAPDLLPSFEKVEEQLYLWKAGTPAAILRLEYRFLHQALLRSLISRIGTDAGEHAIYWKYGLWLRSPDGTQLFIRQESATAEEAPGAGTLYIAAQGADWARLIEKVRRLIRAAPVLEKPEESLELGGAIVARRALESAVDGKVRSVDGRIVAAQPYAAFWNERREEGKAEMPEKEPAFEAAPLPRPEVYLSYAWGDDSPDGKVRSEMADRLCESLRRDGFKVHRDRDALQPGELISGFIDNLIHGKFVVAIISEKYLHSRYCMYELYKLYQACQGEKKRLAERVIPLVLPGVKIGNLRERAPYLKHWSQEDRELSALMKDPDIRPGEQSTREYRLVRDFANHIDDILAFIQDVLMPRQLDAHLEGDFEALREALKRRLGP